MTLPPERNRVHIMRRGACAAVCALVLLSLGGCGGGNGPTPPVVSLQPVAPMAIDGGQTAVLTAMVHGDGSAMGVSWSVQCPGASACGSMQSPTTASGATNYFQSVVSSSAQTIQITATSVQDPTEYAVVDLAVNPPPYALPVAPQTATLGVSFTLSVLPFLQSGTPPYSCLQAGGSLPAGLAFDVATNRIFGTPTTVTALVTSSYACNDSANPPVYTASALVVGIQVLAPGAGASASLMGKPRYGQTETLLVNGSVLIAGGRSLVNSARATADPAYASAELYDPATHSFAATGNLTTGRATHTATLLPSGRVLLAGGSNPVLAPVSELYDPETGTFAPTGPMTTARSEHTATALPGGQILLVGGIGANGRSLASAEIYDPATGTFNATGSMSVVRTQHAAALLNDGRVLISGGTDGSVTLASAEIFDPATGQFSSTGSMLVARRWHTATTLETGQVLVTGGELIDAGVAVPLSSAELYEPDSGSFAANGTMGFARSQHTATVGGGSLIPAPVIEISIKPQRRAGARTLDASGDIGQ